MTSPTESADADTVSMPNYTLGVLLNIILSGSGFTYIGRWGWHLVWAATPALLFLSTVALNLPIPFSLMLALGLAGLGVMLAQYHAAYQQQVARRFQPPLGGGVKAVLILRHLLLGSTLILNAIQQINP